MNLLTYIKAQPLNLDFVVFTPIKKCPKCVEIKAFLEFYKDKSRRFGISNLCKECTKIRNKKYYGENLDEIKKQNKKYREENPDKVKEQRKKYREENPDKVKEKRKYTKDPIYRTAELTRSRILKIFKSKGLTKNKKTLEMLGTTFENFTFHLESQFKDGMTWENQGKVWHIDHKVPISLAKTEEEVYKLNHYTNLQPLFGEENLSKSAKLLPEHEELYKTLLSR